MIMTEVNLSHNEQVTIKCLEENLNKYTTDNESANIMIDIVKDYFILDHIDFDMTRERLRKQLKRAGIKEK